MVCWDRSWGRLFQAFNMTGGEKIWLCVHDLKEDIKTLHYASKEDDKRDDDHDGIPDVKQVRVCVRPLCRPSHRVRI